MKFGKKVSLTDGIWYNIFESVYTGNVSREMNTKSSISTFKNSGRHEMVWGTIVAPGTGKLGYIEDIMNRLKICKDIAK